MGDDDAAVALRLAERAIDRLDQHERFCEERARKSETFEAEVRAGQSNIVERIDNSTRRLHERMDEDSKERADARVEHARTQSRQQVIWGLITTSGAISAASIIGYFLK